MTIDALGAIQEAGKLVNVSKPVDPARNLAAVARAIFEAHGKASLFEDIPGFAAWRVAGHLLADRSMWAAAFDLRETELLPTLRKRMSTPIAPIRIAETPFDHVRARVDFGALPLPVIAERDSTPQFAAIATAFDPYNGRDAAALIQLKVRGNHQLAILDMPPSLRRVHDAYASAGRSMPVALAVGVDPALYLAGAMALGRRQVDFSLAGALRGNALEIFTLDGVPAPARAEYVIAAEVATQSPPGSDASSNLIGTYSRPQTTHVVVCDAIHRRSHPVHWSISPTTLLAMATELLLWEHIQNIEGGIDILDIRCLPYAGSLVAVVKMRPRVQGQAKTALLGSLSGPAYWLKFVIAVDEDIDAASIRDVFWSIASRTHAAIDVETIDGLRMLHADPTATRVLGRPCVGSIGSRWLIDSTMPALSQPERRVSFRRALPKNFDSVKLSSYHFE